MTMEAVAVAEKPKQQGKILTPLKLETLGKGVGYINSDYPLDEVIKLIKSLNVKTSVWTSEPESALGIAFPTPTLFRINRLGEFGLTTYITGPLKKQEPEFRAKGERQMWCATSFIVSIRLSSAKEGNNQEVKKILLKTKLSREKLELIIKETIGKIPPNWSINSMRIPPIKTEKSAHANG